MNKEEMRKMLPLIKEWAENEDAELYYEGCYLPNPSFDSSPGDYEIKYPKKMIIVNGIEVPAPEEKKPENRSEYFIPGWQNEINFNIWYWDNDELDNDRFEKGIVYLNKQDAIARAKAMLVYKEK